MALPHFAPPSNGEVFEGRYLIERLLGEGGFGQVYLAKDTGLLSRRCAIKSQLITAGSGSNADQVKRELYILARLKDFRHLPIVYQHIPKDFREGTCHYIVMEYVAGETLEKVLEVLRPGQAFNHILGISLQILDALDYLHSQTPAILHRDLNPRNVMIDGQGVVKVIDLGNAYFVQPGAKAPPIGSPCYAPPEQALGLTDTRSDIYSLGAIMHYALTGSDPESPGTLRPPYPPVLQLNSSVNPALAALVDRALQPNPQLRPNSAKEFRANLEAIDAVANNATTAQQKPKRPQIFTSRPTWANSKRFAAPIVVLLGLACFRLYGISRYPGVDGGPVTRDAHISPLDTSDRSGVASVAPTIRRSKLQRKDSESLTSQPVPEEVTVTPDQRKRLSHARSPSVPHHAEEIQIDEESGTGTLRTDSSVFAEPRTSSRIIKSVAKSHRVQVTGVTEDRYIRLILRSGEVGFIPMDDVYLVRRTDDRIVDVLSGSPVLDTPTRWGQPVAQIQVGGKVRVIGDALQYVKIRMHSGVEGFVKADSVASEASEAPN